MSKKSNDAKLAEGAAEIEAARKEAATTKAISEKALTKLDGTLATATKRLIELHNQIQIGVQTTFSAAIEAGKILCSIHDSHFGQYAGERRGKWLKWLADNVPFSQPTAWRYMECYKNRAHYSAVNNLADAYKALDDRPGKRKRRKRDPVIEELVSKGIASDERDARRIVKEREQADEAAAIPAEPPVVAEPQPQPQPQPQPKGWQPGLLTEADLTDEEQGAIRILASVSPLRRKAIIRAICEGGLLQ